MIESRDNVPFVYTLSRDYLTFLKLLDLITVSFKSDVDNISSLLNSDKCKSEYLPLLASYVGYEYDYNLSYEQNRMIIKYYPQMMRLKGSKLGITLASAVAINMGRKIDNISDSVQLVNVVYNVENEEMNVYLYYNNYVDKIYDLVEAVRPIGTRVNIIEATTYKESDVVDISDYATTLEATVTSANRNIVMKGTETDSESIEEGIASNINKVGFGEANDSLSDEV